MVDVDVPPCPFPFQGFCLFSRWPAQLSLSGPSAACPAAPPRTHRPPRPPASPACLQCWRCKPPPRCSSLRPWCSSRRARPDARCTFATASSTRSSTCSTCRGWFASPVRSRRGCSVERGGGRPRAWPAPHARPACRAVQIPGGERQPTRARSRAPPPPAALHGGYNTISNHKGSALMLLVLMAGHTSTLYT